MHMKLWWRIGSRLALWSVLACSRMGNLSPVKAAKANMCCSSVTRKRAVKCALCSLFDVKFWLSYSVSLKITMADGTTLYWLLIFLRKTSRMCWNPTGFSFIFLRTATWLSYVDQFGIIKCVYCWTVFCSVLLMLGVADRIRQHFGGYYYILRREYIFLLSSNWHPAHMLFKYILKIHRCVGLCFRLEATFCRDLALYR